MEGSVSTLPDADFSGIGIIPRAVNYLFSSTENLADNGWTFEMSATFIEVYNEQIRDLLAQESFDKNRYEIRHLGDGSTVVTNARIGKKKKKKL